MSRIEDQVCAKIQQRADFGLQKYGTTMERDDLSFLDWVQHVQDEVMDAAVYLEKIKMEYAPRELAIEIDRFEMWFLTSTNKPDLLNKDESGRYLNQSTRMAWASWKAALNL